MSLESDPTIHNPEAPDAGLTQQPAVEQQAQGLEQTRQLDPRLLALAVDPDSLAEDEQLEVIKIAEKEAAYGRKIIVHTRDGQPRWGKEYTRPDQAFTFNGQLRGKFDRISRDTGQQTPAMDIANILGGHIEGAFTDVIIETETETLHIRRTGDKKSADLQEFELSSTTREQGRTGQKGLDILQLDKDSGKNGMLKDVIVVPGHPLILGRDPVSGKRPRTRGPVLKITTFNSSDDGVVAPNHPRLQKPEIQSSAIEDFNERIRAARKGELGRPVGAVALGEVTLVATAVEPTATDVQPTTPELTDNSLEDVDRQISLFLEENNIDLSLANQTFIAKAREFVRNKQTVAKQEGRSLTPSEVTQVKNVIELLSSQQDLAKRLS